MKILFYLCVSLILIYLCHLDLLVFVLAALCWTKSLLCNVAAFTGMLFYPESTLQLCSSRRFYEIFKDLFWLPGSLPDDVEFRPDAYQSATSVRTTRTFRPDAHQCLEASNSSRLHLSERNGKSSERSSEFEKIPVFQRIRPDNVVYRPDAIQGLTSIRVSASRHSCGKTVATVRTMCDPVRTMSSIRQNMHTKFNCLGVSIHGPDDQASYMEIGCTSSTVQTTILLVRTLQSLIMVITCSQSATVRTLGQHRPDTALYGSFQCYFGKAVAVDRPNARSSCLDTLGYFGHNVLLKYQIGTKLASLES